MMNKLDFVAEYVAHRVKSFWDVGPLANLLRRDLVLWGKNFTSCLAVAAPLAFAYSKGEADAWCAADKHYASAMNDEYNEGYENGFDSARRRICDH